jgi:hypothetical protein
MGTRMRSYQWLFAVVVISLMLMALVNMYPDTEPAQRHQQAAPPVLPQSVTYVGPNRRPVIQTPVDRRGQKLPLE